MRITVVALGKIGLPLAVQFATKGHDVVGYDINPEVVRLVNTGQIPFPGETDLDTRLAEVTRSGSLTATTDCAEAVSRADAVVVVVPLVVDSDGLPDFNSIDRATRQIATSLRSGTLVTFETTLPVGTTRTRFAPLLAQISGLTLGRDLFVAFSPERVFTGRVFQDLRRYPKLIGGVEAESAKRARELYEVTLDFDERGDLPVPNGVWDLGSADAAWYTEIAARGYDAGPFEAAAPHNWVFFPLFPAVLHAIMSFGGDPIIFGAVLSNVLFFVSLVVLYRLAAIEGLSKAAAQRAIWLLALAPTSYFFSAPLTESLFLLLVATTWLAWRVDRPGWSGTMFALAILTRPTGLLLAPAYLAEAWQHRRAAGAGLLYAVVLPLCAAAAFPAYLWSLTGNAFAFAANQIAWGRPAGGIAMLMDSAATAAHVPILPWNFTWLNGFAIATALFSAIVFLRYQRWEYTLFLALPAAALIQSGTVLSGARITMVLFPLYFVLAWMLHTPTRERVAFAALTALLTGMVVMYATLTTAGMA